MNKLEKPLIFFDLETTGTNVAKDRIVQIGAIKFFQDGRSEEKNILINPEMDIPAAATAVHGISDEDIKDEPPFRRYANSMLKWFENCDLAGFNSNNFDIPLLSEEFARCGLEFPSKDTVFIDVFLLEKLLNGHSLGATYKRYTGEELENAHDAMVDIRATHQIFLKQLEKSPEYNTSLSEIAEKCNRGKNWVDLSKKIYEEEGIYYFGFGKHKNTAISEVPEDYVDWFMNGDFTRNTKMCLQKIIASLKRHK